MLTQTASDECSAPLQAGDSRSIHPHQHPRQRLTIDEAIEAAGIGSFHYRLVGIVGFMFGAEAIEIFLWTFIKPKVQSCGESGFKNISDAVMAMGPTCTFLGMVVGCFAIGALADKKGRYLASFLSILIPLIGTIMMVLAPHIAVLLLANFVAGIGIGGSFILPAAMIELLPKYNRELWIALAYSIWTFGVLGLCGAAYLLHNSSWRLLCGATAIPFAVALAIFSHVFPESPRCLVTLGKVQEAVKVLARIARDNGHNLASSADAPGDDEAAKHKKIVLRALLAEEVQLVDAHGAPCSSHFTDEPTERTRLLQGGGGCSLQSPASHASSGSRKLAATESLTTRFLNKCTAAFNAAGEILRTLLSKKLRQLTVSLWCIWGATSEGLPCKK